MTETATPPATKPDGVIDSFMSRLLGRSWRTSSVGIASFLCAVVPLVPAIPKAVGDFCATMLPFILGGGFMVAKDGKVFGPKK